MAKLYIYLSGKLEPDFKRKLSSNDCFICFNDKVDIPVNSLLQTPSKISESTEKSIAKAMLDIVEKIKDKNKIKAPIIKSFINDYFSYSIKPAYSTIASILDVINQHKDKEVVFISAKYNSQTIPMHGFKNTESLKGSSHLFYASLLPHILSNLNNETKYTVIYRPGDVLVSNFFRVSFLKVINKALFIMFISKTLLINFLLRKAHNRSNVGALILVRNNHQLRFASDISSNMRNSDILFLPQLSQGSLNELFKICNEIKSKGVAHRISIKSILKSYIKTKSDIKEINRASCIPREKAYIDGISLDIDLEVISKEVRSLNIFIYYRNLIQELLSSSKTKKLINFELVGRMAGIESLAANSVSVQNISVQTALISATPLPVFPHASLFLTDSAPTKFLIENIGIEKKGEIQYLGAPYKLKRLKERKHIEKVGFFTQPYELRYSLEIIKVLLEWCKTNGTKLVIRYHPRDNPELYQNLLIEYSECYIEDLGDQSLNKVFDSIDVSITKTSSTAKESIANGIPVILCLWSELDNSIVADYISNNSSMNYCTHNKNELNNLLNSGMELLLKNASQLQQTLFLDKRLENLCMELENV